MNNKIIYDTGLALLALLSTGITIGFIAYKAVPHGVALYTGLAVLAIVFFIGSFFASNTYYKAGSVLAGLVILIGTNVSINRDAKTHYKKTITNLLDYLEQLPGEADDTFYDFVSEAKQALEDLDTKVKTGYQRLS